MRKSLKTFITVLLALSLAVVPDLSAFYSSGSGLAYASAVAADTSGSSTDYSAAAQLAKLKASVLTNAGYGATSVQYALIDNGKIVISGQSGNYDKENTTPLTESSLYGIGSVSKMFTTAAVMQLVEDGKVKLDKPVKTYISDFTMKDPRYKDITVRMILNHSSGLMGSNYHNGSLFGEITSRYDILSALKDQRLKDDPGAFSVYCNDGFSLAEVLIERVSGISFTDYIRKYISNPLDMDHTFTPYDSFTRASLVKNYLPGSKTALPVESLAVVGAGGIYSTAEDLCRFADIFMKSSDSQVLSPASAEAMADKEYLKGLWPDTTMTAFAYGLGWDSVNLYPFNQYDIRALCKGGDTFLYHCSLIVLPEENMAMAVLSSGGSSSYDELMAKEVLLSALKAKGSIRDILPDHQSVKQEPASLPANAKSWEGIYALTGGVLKVSISDDGILTLKTLLPGISIQKFNYAGDGRFYYSDGSAYVSFVNESNGNTYLYVEGYVSYPGLGQTAHGEYQAQKLEANPISDTLKAAWKKRDNKKYFFVNEVYNSQFYALSQPIMTLELLNDLEGYYENAAILDENTARTNLQIPGLHGRDLADFEFFTSKGIEYLKTSGYTLISEDAVVALPGKAKFTCTIQVDGYARWYRIDEKSAKKKITVVMPPNSSFSVYDFSGNCKFSSTIEDSRTVTLPSYGYVVFAGSPKAKFTVTYSK